MVGNPKGNAIVYCEGAFGTTTGKTAHGLVRRSHRYQVVAIVDSTNSGQDAGQVLDGRANGIPIISDIGCVTGTKLTHFVIGLAPDGGRLEGHTREAVKKAIAAGLNVDSGLHDYLSDDPEISQLARQHGVQIRDVRKPPDKNQLHFFSGNINQVRALKVAVLGTDSAVGKRTTAWALVDGLIQAGMSAELVGTGQTAWLQGARYGIRLDALVNDFVAGELEHAVWSAWRDTQCAAIVIEGQGSLMHPAYPGGFEILAACRPNVVVMQHAPTRKDYDGFPGHPVAPLEKQIQAVELISNSRVVGITINHEGLQHTEIDVVCESIRRKTGIPVCDVLWQRPKIIVDALLNHKPAIR